MILLHENMTLETSYLSSKKSPKSSTTTAAGNVSCRWNAAK